MTIVQVVFSLGVGRGGLTRIIYERAKLIPKDVNLIIAVVGCELHNQKEIFDELRSKGEFPPHTIFRSFYDEIIAPNASENARLFINDELSKKYNVTGGSIYLKKENNNTKIKYTYDNRGVLVAIEHMIEDKYICREFFDIPFSYTEKLYYRKNNTPYMLEFNVGSKIKRYFYSINGDFVFSYTYTDNIKKSDYLFNNNGNMEYSSSTTLCKYWLNKLIEEIDDNDIKILFDEPMLVDCYEQFKLICNNIHKNVMSIFTSHEIFYKEKKLEDSYLKPYVKKMSNFDIIVVQTEMAKSYLRKYLDTTINVIPNSSRFLMTERINRKLLKNKIYKILYVARIHNEKMPIECIKAFSIVLNKMHKSVMLEFVGNGPLMDECRELVDNLNIGNYVNFHGYIEDVSDLYVDADIFLFLSTGESFGNTLIESMQYSLPIVCSRVPFGPQEIIKNGVNGIYIDNSKDVEEIANKVISVLTDNDLYERLSFGSYNSFNQKYKDVFAIMWKKILIQ